MKKKLVAAFLTLCMAAGTLAGCGGDSSSASGDTSTTGTEENKTEEKGETTEAQESVKMSAEELKSMGLEAEDTDLTGEFTYWSAFTGDSQVWDQSRVDAFNELYKDKGIKCNVQFVPDGAGINNGKLLSAIAGGQAPDLVICDNATAA